MIYELILTSKFRKDLKAIIKRGYDVRLLDEVVENLRTNKKLPEKLEDHPLHGHYIGHRECHIAPDWLLVYKIEADILILSLTRTGSYSDLFR